MTHWTHKTSVPISSGTKIMLMAFFFFFFRHFRLHLTPNTGLFDEEFHAYSVGSNDVKTEIPINKDSFYRGYDEGMVRLLMIVIIVLMNWQKFSCCWEPCQAKPSHTTSRLTMTMVRTSPQLYTFYNYFTGGWAGHVRQWQMAKQTPKPCIRHMTWNSS